MRTFAPENTLNSYLLLCGIVGYIGKRQAYPILIEGLRKLEYRGYDSAGVALVTDGDQQQLNVYKAKGKVADLEGAAKDKNRSGTLGIAHTRWATHGVPSEANAHPHLSQTGDITLVHNGIIENYATLRDQVQSTGKPEDFVFHVFVKKEPSYPSTGNLA